jgi:hypothetical protein
MDNNPSPQIPDPRIQGNCHGKQRLRDRGLRSSEEDKRMDTFVSPEVKFGGPNGSRNRATDVRVSEKALFRHF